MSAPLWNEKNIMALFDLPFFELISQAYNVHKQNFNPQDMEFCSLSSIKTGACPEDCAYCPQSGHYQTGLKKEKLLDLATIIAQAKNAKAQGAKRFCMGAAWKKPSKKDLAKVLDMIRAVRKLGLETCVTLGALDFQQAQDLKQAGLDYYNHNLDTSAAFYPRIITTRTYDERLQTITHIINANIHLCCGGILGMGESRQDRIALLLTLYHLPTPPKSIPINKLIAIKGTPLGDTPSLDHFEFIKTIAITRLMFNKAMIRLSAGRENMYDLLQAWCFMAGANSIFIGDKLLTAKNADPNADIALLEKLNIDATVGSKQKCHY
jgi:biotin synthase